MTASGVFNKVFQKESLKGIFLSSVKFNGAIGIDGINTKVFEKNLDSHISIISKKVLNGSYLFSQYREKLLLKGAGKFPRVISIPTVRDKITLKGIFQVLVSVFRDDSPVLHQIINDVINEVKKTDFDSVIRLDIKNFYPSIRHDILLQQLSKKIKKKEIINLITNALSKQTISKGNSKEKRKNSIGVPQGLAISNVLANVYMLPIDRKYSKRRSLKYFRYVDDILILCKKNNIQKIKLDIQNDLNNIGLTLHPEEEKDKNHVGFIEDGFTYLGYVFSGTKISARDTSISKLRNSIINSFTQYKYSQQTDNPRVDKNRLFWILNLRISGCQFNNTKYGWLFYFSQINDLQLLGALDHFVFKQLEQFGLGNEKAKVKKFIRSYHEITRNLKDSTYIPNYDDVSIGEKKEILNRIFKIKTEKLSDKQIDFQFRRNIFRSVKDIEKDLSKQS